MPSHIYTRVGYWKESIDSNIASVKAAKAEKSVGNYLHAQDYMVYAHLQLAQDKQARAVMDEMMKETEFKATVSARRLRAGGFAGALCGRARRLERRVATVGPAEQLQLRDGDLALRPRARRRALRQAGSRQGRRRTSSPSCATSCAKPRTTIGRRSSTSSVRSRPPGCCHAEGKHDEALKAMSAAADAEDKTEKHAVTPGPLAPARELYGFMLLDRGMAKEALAAFEATKAKEPNRFHGFAGAAKAAEKLGDKAAARAATTSNSWR